MLHTTIGFTPSQYEYYQRLSTREPELLTRLRDETEQAYGNRMQISPEQGQFMKWLIKLIQAKKTLDIGTYTGYSALVVAQALPEGGKVITCDISKSWTDMAKRFWQQAGELSKIDLKLAPAQQTLESLIDNNQLNQFDFAFIDADKENYITYYELCLKLIRPGGVIAIDNVLWSGKVADPSVQDIETVTLRQLNQHIHQDKRVSMCMIPISDGLTLVTKGIT